MYGFIYIWYDCARSKQNGPDKIKRYYIGRHKIKNNDTYICSSNWMRDAYRRRPQDFKRRIIKWCKTKEELKETEGKWLSLIKDEELGKRYYNLTKSSHWGILEHSEDNIKKIKKALPDRSGVNHPMWGKKHRPESIEKMKKPKTTTINMSIGKKKSYDNGYVAPFKGCKHKEESIEKMKPTQFKKGQIPWNKGRKKKELTSS